MELMGLMAYAGLAFKIILAVFATVFACVGLFQMLDFFIKIKEAVESMAIALNGIGLSLAQTEESGKMAQRQTAKKRTSKAAL